MINSYLTRMGVIIRGISITMQSKEMEQCGSRTEQSTKEIFITVQWWEMQVTKIFKWVIWSSFYPKFDWWLCFWNQEIIYPNGDKRIGYLSPNVTGHWDGVATFIEANGFSTSSEEIGLGFFDESVKGNKWSEKWILKNSSSTYKPEARIYKSVINKVHLCNPSNTKSFNHDINEPIPVMQFYSYSIIKKR